MKTNLNYRTTFIQRSSNISYCFMANSESNSSKCTREMQTTVFQKFFGTCKRNGQSIKFQGPYKCLAAYLFLCCLQASAAAFMERYTSIARSTHDTTPHSTVVKECGSIDIRNECSSFKILENCTVVKGYLLIVLLPKDKYLDNGPESCDYDNIRFPLLREVTDYIIMFHVKGLRTIREMFPHLAVIRGRRLFLNYAVGITEMPDLEAIEFRSLVAIQRGHVFIGSSPNLRQLERINWDRLTLTTGQNHIYPIAQETTNTQTYCNGCPYEYCWSYMVCQKFENDNVLNLPQGAQHCHEECLGGCYNTSNAGCNVCRGLTDHGLCVKECPPDKFLHEHSQRCYTREECTHGMRLFISKHSCVSHCPSGFTKNNNGSCIACASHETCYNICQPEPYSEDLIYIYDLSDADDLASCNFINGTLMVIIRNKIDENDLAKKLENIREIKGYLKVYRSPYLTSLKFLSNLKKIHGNPSESGHYSLIVYDNKNLKELWKPQQLELEHGGMYIHLNNRLCNQVIMEFREKVTHDLNMDSIQTSDQETLCGPVKLLLDIQVLSHRELLFSWHKEQTADQIEVIYRPISRTETFSEESELDTPVCQRIKWQRELIFKSDLIDNGTHYSYAVKGLVQNTRYACMVKTFGSIYKHNARSDLRFMSTKADIPPPPDIKITKKTDSSITFNLNPSNASLDYILDYYLLEVYKKPDDVHYLDKRNYCLQPAYFTKNLLSEAYSNSAYDEDYDDCCARVEDDNEDERFSINMRAEFSCSLDRKEHCLTKPAPADTEKPIINLRLSSNEPSYELQHLERFRLYVIMVKACNEIGCSSFGMHSERTNFTTAADLVGELEGCHTPNTTEYRVYFSEPKQPNGAIVSYVVHFRMYAPQAEHFQSHIGCVTRQEHQKSNYFFVRHIHSTFNQVAVRAHSLAGDAITHWVNMMPCESPRLMSTKLAEFNKKALAVGKHSGHSVNIFLLFFILGCVGTGLWACYKQRFWRKLPELRHLIPWRRTREVVRAWVDRDESLVAEDRQILVDNFETVRFQNRHNDDDDNETTYSSLSERSY